MMSGIAVACKYVENVGMLSCSDPINDIAVLIAAIAITPKCLVYNFLCVCCVELIVLK
jgi:hypothetical protein